MAITAQRLLSDGRAEIVSVAAGDRERTWIIRVNSVEDTEDGIYESGALPLVGSSLAGNFQMTLRSYSVDRIGKFLFRIVGQYSSRNETQQEREARKQQEYPIPWQRSPSITAVVNEYSDEPLKDIYGTAIKNSFGTPFTSTQPRRRWTPIIRVRAPVASVPSWYYALAGKRNSGAVTIYRKTGPLPTFPAGTLLFVPGDLGEYKQNAGFIWEEINFDLHYDADEWEWEPVDMGPKYLNAEDKEADFTDGMGFLDGTGHEGSGDSPTVLQFQHYETASFADLPLTEF